MAAFPSPCCSSGGSTIRPVVPLRMLSPILSEFLSATSVPSPHDLWNRCEAISTALGSTRHELVDHKFSRRHATGEAPFANVPATINQLIADDHESLAEHHQEARDIQCASLGGVCRVVRQRSSRRQWGRPASSISTDRTSTHGPEVDRGIRSHSIEAECSNWRSTAPAVVDGQHFHLRIPQALRTRARWRSGSRRQDDLDDRRLLHPAHWQSPAQEPRRRGR